MAQWFGQRVHRVIAEVPKGTFPAELSPNGRTRCLPVPTVVALVPGGPRLYVASWLDRDLSVLDS